MLLWAIVEGTDVVAPLLANNAGQQLWSDVRAGVKCVVLPCWRRRGLLRTSRRGLKHFYHARGDHDEMKACEGARGETMAHLAAKVVIAAARARAEYMPATEWTEQGWRADVLAVRGVARNAFEVQWSRQALQMTPNPLHLRTSANFPIEQAIHSVLALTLLHFGSLRSPRLPVTIHYSDEIAYLALQGIKPTHLEGTIPYWL